MKDVDVGIVTRASAKIGYDGPWIQVSITSKKKVAFDIAIEKDTFFDAKNIIRKNLGKLPIVDMPFAFDPSVEVGLSR